MLFSAARGTLHCLGDCLGSCGHTPAKLVVTSVGKAEGQNPKPNESWASQSYTLCDTDGVDRLAAPTNREFPSEGRHDDRQPSKYDTTLNHGILRKLRKTLENASMNTKRNRKVRVSYLAVIVVMHLLDRCW